jgi:hypothetical protein
MRTETELAPLQWADFKARSGFLEQGTSGSWERLVQSEMTLRGRTTRPINTRITLVGLAMSSISAVTLILAEIYRHLGGAITRQIQAATPLQIYLVAGIIVGLALGFCGRFVSGKGEY